MKEVEDSSPVDYTSTKVTLLLSKSFSTTPQQVSTTFNGSNNQDYSCTYPLRIEHASMVKKVEMEIEKETKVNPRQEPHQKR